MKGRNSFILNQSTMIEALQYWLNSKWLGEAPIVDSVKTKDSMVNSFEISLKENEKENPKEEI